MHLIEGRTPNLILELLIGEFFVLVDSLGLSSISKNWKYFLNGLFSEWVHHVQKLLHVFFLVLEEAILQIFRAVIRVSLLSLIVVLRSFRSIR